MNEYLQEWGRTILWAAVLLVVLFFFCWPVRISGSSMEPTVSEGDIVLVSRFAAMQGECTAGDIVLFRYTDDAESKTVIKRIIATAGERICILDNGSVAVDDAVCKEDYVQGETWGLVDMTVPEDTVFVMGDNRENSFDSRNMGAIPCESLKGKVIFRLFPFGKL